MLEPKFVSIGGTRTRYFEGGEGEAMVLIHGGQYGDPISALGWSLNFDSLARHFHVFALDRLGQGYTDHPESNDDYTVARSITHTRDFMKEMGIKDAHVVGHSRGGFVAGLIALESPGLVKTLCAIDSGSLAPDDPPRVGDFYTELEQKAVAMELREGIQFRIRSNSFSTNHVTEEWVDDLCKVAVLPKTVEYKNKTHAVPYGNRMRDVSEKRRETMELLKAGHLKIPTLLVWGFNDPSALVDRGVNLFRIISPHASRSQLHVFNQAGHYSYREHAADFNDILTSFVSHS